MCLLFPLTENVGGSFYEFKNDLIALTSSLLCLSLNTMWTGSDNTSLQSCSVTIAFVLDVRNFSSLSTPKLNASGGPHLSPLC
jgi:hypothetical protein